MDLVGTKNKVLSSKPVACVCADCTHAEQYVHTFQTYFHIFSIPIFPIRKHSVLECQQCNKLSLEKELSDQRKAIVKLSAGSVKAPPYMYAGSVALALLASWSVYNFELDSTRTEAFLSRPAASDVAVIEAGQGQFQVLRLIAIEGGRIRYQISQYVYKNVGSAKAAIKKRIIDEAGFFADGLHEMPVERYQKSHVEFVQRHK
jgi:hypothetical protein